MILTGTYVHAKSHHSCPTLCTPKNYSLLGSSVHGILQQEYWSGLPCPPPGDLPWRGDGGWGMGLPLPRIKPESLMSPALQADSLPLVPPGKPQFLQVTLVYPL